MRMPMAPLASQSAPAREENQAEPRMKHGKTRKKRALGWYLFAFMRVLPVFDPWLGFWCIMKITWRQWLKNVLAGRTKPRR